MSTALAKYLTISEVAERLGLTRQRVHQLIKSGQLAAEDSHWKLILVHIRDVEKFEAIERPTGIHRDNRQKIF